MVTEIRKVFNATSSGMVYLYPEIVTLLRDKAAPYAGINITKTQHVFKFSLYGYMEVAADRHWVFSNKPGPHRRIFNFTAVTGGKMRFSQPPKDPALPQSVWEYIKEMALDNGEFRWHFRDITEEAKVATPVPHMRTMTRPLHTEQPPKSVAPTAAAAEALKAPQPHSEGPSMAAFKELAQMQRELEAKITELTTQVEEHLTGEDNAKTLSAMIAGFNNRLKLLEAACLKNGAPTVATPSAGSAPAVPFAKWRLGLAGYQKQQVTNIEQVAKAILPGAEIRAVDMDGSSPPNVDLILFHESHQHDTWRKRATKLGIPYLKGFQNADRTCLEARTYILQNPK